jgi:predicted DNA-binding antitoxin AbrB/MazE fold protein
MTTAVNAVYEDGVFKPETPVGLRDKTKVRLVIESLTKPEEEHDDPTGWRIAEELIGCIEDGPEDGAENHDRYIYDKER